MEISEFLIKNKIIIFFDREELIKLNLVDLQDIPYIFEKILIVSEDGKFMPSHLLDNLFVNGKKINFLDYYLELLKIRKEWEKLNIGNFPNIIFENSATQLFYFREEKSGSIIISPNELSSINRFKFSVGHELGHLYFYNNGLDKICYDTIEKSFFPKEYFLIFLFNLLLFVTIVLSNNFSYIYLISLFVPFLFFLVSFFSIKERVLSFTMEYFCDYFSKKINKNLLDCDDILDFDFLDTYTHPSNRRRIYELKLNISNWENPLLTNYRYHRLLNVYEVSFFIQKKIYNLLGKI